MKVRQWKSKLPWVIFWLAIGSVVILMCLVAPDSTWDDEFPRSKALFLGAWSVGFAILWFFFGSIDLSQWNEIKRRLGKGKPEPPDEVAVESVTGREQDAGLEGLPTSFIGWCSALAGACVLIWFLVSFVAKFCGVLLQ